MKHVTINGVKSATRLEAPVELSNGSLVVLKNGEAVQNVYLVVSFRDGKNRYGGESTTSYCSLVNIDTGYFAFEERCSRKTTVRRVLNHLLNLGTSSYAFNSHIPAESYGKYDIEYYGVRDYKIDISF